MKPRDPAASSNGEAAPEELLALLRNRAPEEQDELVHTWHLAAYVRKTDPAPEAVQRAGDAFRAALTLPHPVLRDRSAVQRSRMLSRAWVGIAALLVCGVALAWYLLVPVTLRVPPGQTTATTLADGSRVVLNSGSMLEHRRGLWGAARTVTLQGEAYFEVVPAAHPFVVRTFNAEVQVVGTAFNVRAWPEDDRPETILAVRTGQVRFVPKQAPATADTLVPGEMSRVVGAAAAAPTAPVAFNPDLAFIWLDGGVAFVARPLADLFVELERKFGIAIEVGPSVVVTDTLTWIQPRLESAEAALVDICALARCRFERGDGGFRVTSSAVAP